VYAAIGGVIAANGYDSVSQRASTSLLRKLVLLARSFFRLPGERPVPPQPALEETRFLVEAVLAEPLALPEYGAPRPSCANVSRRRGATNRVR